MESVMKSVHSLAGRGREAKPEARGSRDVKWGPDATHDATHLRHDPRLTDQMEGPRK